MTNKKLLSPSVEDYLGAIYRLRAEQAAVTTTALAAAMGVSPASTTNMIKKLAALKLVRHSPYHGVELTPAGEKIALEVHDQLPVARHESIKVKLESSDPKPAEQSEMNELTWRLSLEPNAKQIVRFDFSVEHPRDFTVTGLP